MAKDIIKSIHNALDELDITRKKRTEITALLGDGRGNVKVPGRPSYVYGRLQYSSGTEAVSIIFAPNVQHFNNNVVEVTRNKIGQWQTVGVAAVEGEGYFHDMGISNVGPHQFSHQYGAPDMLWIDSRQVTGLLVHPTSPPSLEVYVQAGLVQTTTGYADLAGQAYDLTDLAPSGIGEQRIVVVGVDRSDGTLTTIESTAAIYTGYHPKTVPFSREDVADLINVEADGYFRPLMAVRLLFGQTEIQGWDTFLDLRWWRDGIVPPEMGGLGSDASAWVGYPFFNSGVTYPVRCVGAATAPPTATDDESSTPPYRIGSWWATSVTAGASFDGNWFLADDTENAAVWMFQGRAYSTANVSNPPTDAELDTAFGTPATLGVGFQAIVNDNGAGTNVYLVQAVGSAWFIQALTLAV